MLMIQKAIEIFKVRWPEVMLVVVVQAAMMLFSEELMSVSETMASGSNAQISVGANFLLGVGSILCVVIWQMLYLGFLKTSAVEGVHPQQPIDLIRFGRPYFWKIIWFQILFIFVLVIFSSAIVAILGGIIWQTQDAAQIPEWFLQVCTMAVIVLMIKPMLFIPARMIVFDNSVIQAVLAMRQYRLNDIDQLFKLMAGGICLIVVFTFLANLATEKTRVYYILTGVHHVVLSLVFLLLALVAVLWVQQHLESLQAQAEEGHSQE